MVCLSVVWKYIELAAVPDETSGWNLFSLFDSHKITVCVAYCYLSVNLHFWKCTETVKYMVFRTFFEIGRCYT